MSSKNDDVPSKTYKVSPAQLKVLMEKAGEDTVKAALIQNGSRPEGFTHLNVSPQQLRAIIQRAGSDAVKAALIQNGSAPTAFRDAK